MKSHLTTVADVRPKGKNGSVTQQHLCHCDLDILSYIVPAGVIAASASSYLILLASLVPPMHGYLASKLATEVHRKPSSQRNRIRNPSISAL